MRTLVAFAVLLAQQSQVAPPPPPPPLFLEELFPSATIPQNGEGVIQGRIRRADTGEGLRAVAIGLTTVEASGLPMTLSTTTDDAGKYEFRNLPLRSYTISSAHEGYFAASADDLPITEGVNPVTLDALHKT